MNFDTHWHAERVYSAFRLYLTSSTYFFFLWLQCNFKMENGYFFFCEVTITENYLRILFQTH